MYVMMSSRVFAGRFSSLKTKSSVWKNLENLRLGMTSAIARESFFKVEIVLILSMWKNAWMT